MGMGRVRSPPTPNKSNKYAADWDYEKQEFNTMMVGMRGKRLRAQRERKQTKKGEEQRGRRKKEEKIMRKRRGKKQTNKDKQGFNNVMVGFGGILLAGYTEGKQTGDATTIAVYKKLAGMLIGLVLKTDPENLRMENGQIVMK